MGLGMINSENICRAVKFASVVHGDQKRKYTNTPYIEHPLEVMEILVEHGVEDENILIASILHDTIEDTEVADYPEIIEQYFGHRVFQYVYDVTDISKPSDGNREMRKGIDRLHTLTGSIGGIKIKLADIISNTKNIAMYDPNFAKVYISEKRKFLDLLVKMHYNSMKDAELRKLYFSAEKNT